MEYQGLYTIRTNLKSASRFCEINKKDSKIGIKKYYSRYYSPFGLRLSDFRDIRILLLTMHLPCKSQIHPYVFFFGQTFVKND